MPKKLAIDWDDSEIRLVAAQCSGGSVKITDAALVPIQDGDVAATLTQAIADRGLENTETLVAIGRGKAELRDLQLPVVPDDELPDMVRFQAIRSFASAGDSAAVDYLVTNRTSENISMLAAAVGPSTLDSIQKVAGTATLTTKRIALRPLAAASLYLSTNNITGETVMIDLLADDAEIVVARGGKVIFVRTVRMPTSNRGKALVGELKRSLIACGSDQSPEKVILWGRQSVHESEAAELAASAGVQVEVVDPFDLVSVESSVQSQLPIHVGRLAPLVGLLKNDESGADRLIDFLNPRKRVIEEPNPLRRIAMVAIPVAIALLLTFLAYKKLDNLDKKIALLKTSNAQMKPKVDDANERVAKTARVDDFLDGNVNWLEELRRLTSQMPPSDKMIVKSILGTSDVRKGGGTLTVAGGVTGPDVIDAFEAALRDDNHQVVGDGSKQDTRAKDAYRWGYNEKIVIARDHVRTLRYTKIKLPPEAEQEPDPDQESDPAPAVEQKAATEEVAEEKADVNEEESGEATGDEKPATETEPASKESATTEQPEVEVKS